MKDQSGYVETKKFKYNFTIIQLESTWASNNAII